MKTLLFPLRKRENVWDSFYNVQRKNRTHPLREEYIGYVGGGGGGLPYNSDGGDRRKF